MKTNLIAFGNDSCKLAEKLHDEDTCNLILFPNTFSIGETIEDGEKWIGEQKPFHSLSSNDYSETLCFIEGGSAISGATLFCLEQFKNKPITVFFIHHEIVDPVALKNQQLVFNILQEYSRSGLFKSFIAFEWLKIADIVTESLNDNDVYEHSEFINLVIDRIIFAINIYWKINHENYIEGDRFSWNAPNYKIMTFFEGYNPIKTYFNLNQISMKNYVLGVKPKMTKIEILKLNNFKKSAKEEKSGIIMFSDENEFVAGFVGSSVIQNNN